MASFYGYVILIVGLSLLLAFAGVQTTTGHLLNTFITVNATSPTGNFTATTSDFNVSTNPWLVALFTIIGTFVIAGGIRIALGGTFGIAETIKVTTVAVLLIAMIADVVAIITYLNGVNYLGGAIKFVAFAVYIPLAIGMVISAIDWIGGGR